ncbi:MAG TPA: hypothetical protein VMG62_02055, partial [Solirubrobacteraceae bacterium]|nr:hypothetical protein [Solirubrobacteraceae bacterium]
YPVAIDSELELWREYENLGWPARYLFDGRARLFEYHYGEGGYLESELAIQELLGISREPLPPQRPGDAPEALLAAQSEDRRGAYTGAYEAGGVWLVLSGEGEVRFAAGSAPGQAPSDGSARDGSAGGGKRGMASIAIRGPGAYPLIEHERHTAGTLELELEEGVICHATCFTPGLA